MRLGNEGLKYLERFLVEPQLGEAVEDGRLVEDAHHDPLAENHRDDTHTNVHLSTANRKLDAPVLR